MAPVTRKKPSKPLKVQKAPKKVQIVSVKDDSTSESEEEEAPPQQLELGNDAGDNDSASELSSDDDDPLADDFLQGSDDEDEGVYCYCCNHVRVRYFQLCFYVYIYLLQRKPQVRILDRVWILIRMMTMVLILRRSRKLLMKKGREKKRMRKLKCKPTSRKSLMSLDYQPNRFLFYFIFF